MQDGKLLKVGNLSIKSGLRKKDYFCVLYGKGSESSAHLDCYDSKEAFQSERDNNKSKSNKKSHSLDHIKCVDKIIKDSKKEYHLDVNTKKEKLLLIMESTEEVEDWYKYVIAVKDGKEGSLPGVGDGSFRTNILYDSSEDTATFEVKMRLNESAQNHFLEGRYKLHITAGGISLEDPKTYKIKFHWPYEFIRKFGKKKDIFAISAGRRCESGEGEFEFELDQPERITHAIDEKTGKKVEAKIGITDTRNGTVSQELRDSLNNSTSSVTKRLSEPVHEIVHERTHHGTKSLSTPRGFRLSNSEVSQDAGTNISRAVDQNLQFKKSLERKLSNDPHLSQEKNEKIEKEGKKWGIFSKKSGGKKSSRSEKEKERKTEDETLEPESYYDEADVKTAPVSVSNQGNDPLYDEAETFNPNKKKEQIFYQSSPVPMGEMYAQAGKRSDAWKQFAQSGDFHEEDYDKVRAAASENKNLKKIEPEKDYQDDDDETYDRLELNSATKRKNIPPEHPGHIYGTAGGKSLDEIEDDYTFAEADQYEDYNTPPVPSKEFLSDDETYDESGPCEYDDALSIKRDLKAQEFEPVDTYEDVDVGVNPNNSKA